MATPNFHFGDPATRGILQKKLRILDSAASSTKEVVKRAIGILELLIHDLKSDLLNCTPQDFSLAHALQQLYISSLQTQSHLMKALDSFGVVMISSNSFLPHTKLVSTKEEARKWLRLPNEMQGQLVGPDGSIIPNFELMRYYTTLQKAFILAETSPNVSNDFRASLTDYLFSLLNARISRDFLEKISKTCDSTTLPSFCYLCNGHRGFLCVECRTKAMKQCDIAIIKKIGNSFLKKRNEAQLAKTSKKWQQVKEKMEHAANAQTKQQTVANLKQHLELIRSMNKEKIDRLNRINGLIFSNSVPPSNLTASDFRESLLSVPTHVISSIEQKSIELEKMESIVKKQIGQLEKDLERSKERLKLTISLIIRPKVTADTISLMHGNYNVRIGTIQPVSDGNVKTMVFILRFMEVLSKWWRCPLPYRIQSLPYPSIFAPFSNSGNNEEANFPVGDLARLDNPSHQVIWDYCSRNAQILSQMIQSGQLSTLASTLSNHPWLSSLLQSFTLSELEKKRTVLWAPRWPSSAPRSDQTISTVPDSYARNPSDDIDEEEEELIVDLVDMVELKASSTNSSNPTV